MEGSLLTPTEQQFYSDWFSSCDQENSGKLTAHQVNKLFVSSQLNQEVLNKITELCGAYRVGHFGRSQFFLALKLIAMVQNGYQIPSSIEGLYSGIEVPLPKFATTRSNIVDQGQAKKDSKVLTTEDKPVQQVNEIRQMEFVNPAFTDHGSEFDPDKSQNRQPRQLPAPPSKSHVRNASSGGLGGLLQPRIPATTGSGSSENSPSSTPPLSDESKMLAPRSKTMDRMHSVPAPGHRKAVDRQASIPIRSDSGWANFTHPPSKSETSEANESVFPPKPDFGHDQGIMSERSDGVKDADEQNGQENVWLISDEQRLYYTEQFKTLQPDVTRIIQGNEAKQFFEKSKLPTTELSKIWQLSDVNKDGALCLEEFCTAMHLSVLRKHKYTLPDILPPCLVPKFNDVSSTDVQEGDTIISAAPTKKKAPPPPDVMNRSVTPSGLAEMSPKSKVKGGEESKIVQPIPLKLAPDGQTCIVSSDPSRPRKFSDPGSVSTPDDEEHLIPAKKRSATLPDSAAHTPTRIAPPPPVDRKASAPTLDLFAGDNVIGLIPRHRPRSHSSSGIRTKHGQQPASVAFLKRARFRQKHSENRQSWEGVLDFEPPNVEGDNEAINVTSFIEVKQKPSVPSMQDPGTGHTQDPGTGHTQDPDTGHTQESDNNKDSRPDYKNDSRPDYKNGSRPDYKYEPKPNGKQNNSVQSPTSELKPPKIPAHPSIQANVKPPPMPPIPAKAPPVPLHPRVKSDGRFRNPGLVRSATVGHSARPRHGRDSASDMPMSPPQIPPRPRENAKNSVSSRNSSSLYSSSEFNSSNSSDDEDDDADGEDEHEDEKEEEPKLLQNFADFSRFENKSESPKYNKYNKSMSLDYRLMGRQQKSEEIIFPPVPPPRPAISEINTLQENKAQTSTQHKERHASGDLLSRKAEDYAKDRTRHQSAPLPIHVKNLKSFSRKGIQDKIRKIKEENTKLSRLNNELQQELKELTQDRIGLEVQFHKCKPFSINS
ncbi:uncharacterized protein [Antedon mediterranea]|uniref:uncharacterized protein isoform X2 n=1 Tax=Antedon mediterranea TaxID=105859 RepID=UPI003AF57C65